MPFNPGNLNWAALGALASGNTVGEQIGNANNVMLAQQPLIQQRALETKTYNYLASQHPELAEQVKAGMPLSEAWRQVNEARQPKKPHFIPLGNGYLFNADSQQTLPPPDGYNQSKLPPSAEEFEYARSQGFKGGFQDYQAYKAGLNKSGFMVEQTPDGFRAYQGDMSSAPAKMTEGQSKDINWLTRGKNSNEELARLDAKLAELGNNTASKLGTPGNYLKDADYQMAERAGRDFLAVVLRKDSGGAITPSEMAEYGPMFLPQPGDKPPAIEAKRKAREVFLKAMQAGLPKNMQSLVPPDAVNTPEAATRIGEPVPVTLPDGTEGTIKRIK